MRPENERRGVAGPLTLVRLDGEAERGDARVSVTVVGVVPRRGVGGPADVRSDGRRKCP